MTCIAPNNNELYENKYFQMNNPWMRKHYIEEGSSDDELHRPTLSDKQPIDRLKDFSTMLATEAPFTQRYSEQPVTPNNRKRLFSEVNTSPDYRNNPEYQEDGRYRLTLSQVATSASEQEPLHPVEDDEDVEEILMRLRHGQDFFVPKLSAPPTLPSLLLPSHMPRPTSHFHDHFLPSPPLSHSPPNKASIHHILTQDPSESVHNVSHHYHPHPHHPLSSHHSLPHPHPMSVHNLHMRKMFFDEGIFESSDEMGLEHPKKKARHHKNPSHSHNNRSPLKSIIVSNNDDVQEKETVAGGLCFKTHKPKVQREYYYAKLSKTIFRWTCCGSQAKTHPDA